MKRIKYSIQSIFTALLVVVIFVAVSCSNEIPEKGQSTEVIRMKLEGGLQEFDDAATRAPKTLPDGAKILIRFANGAYATAIYSTSSTDWSVSLTGSLSSTSSGECTLFYSPAPKSLSGSSLTLDSSTPLYTAQGTYSYSSPVLKVTATLVPSTPRVRFKGAPGITISLSGLTYYSGVDVSKSSPLSTTPSDVSLTVSGSYTNYVYGYFADSNRELKLTSNNVTYKRNFGTDTFITGQSGWLNLPTANNYAGWTKVGGGSTPSTGTVEKKTFTVRGVSFDMILVEHGTFTMGATSEQQNPEDDEKPAHQVTISKDYYMGETEVTQALWKAVTGYSPTPSGSSWSSIYGLGANYPAYYITYYNVKDFLTKLNQMTGQTFRMPTEAEWEYAARGGQNTRGYQYSGSNTIGDVAWYWDNGAEAYPVKTKVPNELGLYDMSGNVSEWCNDWYGSYGSSIVIDPTGPISGSNRVYRGGCWSSDDEDCRVAIRNYASESYRSTHLGFRLCLDASAVGGDTPSDDSHEYVDLGLSVKWATCNVGAHSPEDYGDYFAWGETTGYNEGKKNFDWSTYKWCKGSETTMTRYCRQSQWGTVDGKIVLESEDDVAHVKWGGSWRMPTDAEFTELRNNCTLTWTTQNGVKGRKVTSKTNGNSIFLPAAGYRHSSDFGNAGSYGGYWSSSLSTSYSDDAYELYFSSGSVYGGNYDRCYGRSVRPVCP